MIDRARSDGRSARNLLAAGALLLVLFTGRCATTPAAAVHPALRDRTDRSVVVFVPGVSGTRLCDAKSGRVLWGNFSSLLFPRDEGRRLALPLGGEKRVDVVPCGPVRQIRIGPWTKDAYGGFLRMMQRNGYTRGDLRDPRRGENFYFFAYDWRRDNVDVSRQLTQQLRGMAAADKERRVTLICQSNAAYICRYLIKYGDVSLDEAEQGRSRGIEGIEIDKIILVGSSNGGSLRILKELDRGRRYVPVIGVHWRPETLFTFRSLFQDLPIYRDDLFIDREGSALPLDLFDSQTWKTEEWSIFSEGSERTMKKGNVRSIFGTPADRERYLATMLRDATRLHRLLQRPAAGHLPRFYSIQSLDFPTPERAVVDRSQRRPFLISPDPEVDENERLAKLANSPGDRHATQTSQDLLAADERAALARPTVHVAGRHFEMITKAATHRVILEMLEE